MAPPSQGASPESRTLHGRPVASWLPGGLCGSHGEGNTPAAPGGASPPCSAVPGPFRHPLPLGCSPGETQPEAAAALHSPEAAGGALGGEMSLRGTVSHPIGKDKWKLPVRSGAGLGTPFAITPAASRHIVLEQNRGKHFVNTSSNERPGISWTRNTKKPEMPGKHGDRGEGRERQFLDEET